LTPYIVISRGYENYLKPRISPSSKPNGLGLLALHCSPLEHPWLPLVSLALHWLPLGSPIKCIALWLGRRLGSPVVSNWEHWNTLGNNPGAGNLFLNADGVDLSTGYHSNNLGNTPGKTYVEILTSDL
jgi:hypothetical protein